MASLVYCLVLPSISEILPGKLYLGNAAAALTPALLEEFKVTHVLELKYKSRKNDPRKIKAELLQLHCDDILGSQDSLLGITKEVMDKVQNWTAEFCLCIALLEDPGHRQLLCSGLFQVEEKPLSQVRFGRFKRGVLLSTLASTIWEQ